MLVRRLASGLTRRDTVRGLVAGAAMAAAGESALGVAEARKRRRRRGHGVGGGGGDGGVVGGPGTCAAGADACASATGAICTCRNGRRGLCRTRMGGGTVCAIGITKPATTACDQCRFDDDCFALGFPPGSSCVQDFGPNCLLCGDGSLGSCMAPCGLEEPA
jgi:hypothetical protein